VACFDSSSDGTESCQVLPIIPHASYQSVVYLSANKCFCSCSRTWHVACPSVLGFDTVNFHPIKTFGLPGLDATAHIVPSDPASTPWVPVKVACRFEENGPCVATFAYASTAHGMSMPDFEGIYRSLGKSCMETTGYCEEKCDRNNENCATTCSAAAGQNIFDVFLNSDILGWIAEFW